MEFIAPATSKVTMAIPGEDYRDVTTWRRDPGVIHREARQRNLGRPHEALPFET
ncbi:hypothetical protein N566_24530 [Streptomycetaceae bacterium MP113-05]|nr:hypothetical protein N566_24530 [Streptomycetaceae bacterium MP113-05]